MREKGTKALEESEQTDSWTDRCSTKKKKREEEADCWLLPGPQQSTGPSANAVGSRPIGVD